MNISAIQLENHDNETKQDRIRHAVSAIKGINNTDLILLPELWGTGFFSYKSYALNSEVADGETFAALSDIAKEKSAYIFTGSFIEKCGDKLYNTALLLDNRGNIAGQYRKIHLCGDERLYLSPGQDICVTKTPLGNIGMSICYDLRFPEMYRGLVDKGAEIFLSCYALPSERLRHWQILTPARALENQALFISCGCAGNNCGVNLAGHSMAVSPYGEIIAEASENEEIMTVNADIDEVKKYRKAFPVLGDRK